MNIEEALKKIKLVIFDVDGTLTDGGMYYSADGDTLKRFYVQDGMGITLLQRAGIEICLLTSENSPIVQARAKKLQIKHVILGCRAKRKSVETLAHQLNLSLDEIAYMGDDVNDEAPMKVVGLGICPSDSVDTIKKISQYVCKKPGGCGAVREFAELLLKAQQKPISLPEVW